MPVNGPVAMVVGSMHLESDINMVNHDFGDVRAPQRQAEIEDIVARLARYGPTKVALEVPARAQERLAGEYAAMRAGGAPPTASEVHQIGLRLAARLGHEAVFAVDWMETVGNRAVSEVYDWARDHQPELYAELMAALSRRASATESGLLSHLRQLNDPARDLPVHRAYLQLARVGEGLDYVGVDWLRWWYQRNLIVAVNVARLCAPGERVLVLFGADHRYLLTQLLRESGLWHLEEVVGYLAA